MRKFLLSVSIILVVLVFTRNQVVIESLAEAQTSSLPSTNVTCTLLSPIAGSTISNTITLSASASSLVGPITRVEFYMDGMMIGFTNIPVPPKPENLRVVP